MTWDLDSRFGGRIVRGFYMPVTDNNNPVRVNSKYALKEVVGYDVETMGLSQTLLN